MISVNQFSKGCTSLQNSCLFRRLYYPRRPSPHHDHFLLFCNYLLRTWALDLEATKYFLDFKTLSIIYVKISNFLNSLALVLASTPTPLFERRPSIFILLHSELLYNFWLLDCIKDMNLFWDSKISFKLNLRF